MTREETIKKLESQKKMACMGCMHPQQVGYCENICELPQTYDMAIEALKQAPRRKGRWIVKRGDTHTNCICSACGTDFYYFNKGQYHIDFSKYCPNCGADMREE